MATLVAKVKGKEVFRHTLSEIKPTIIGRGEKTDVKLEIHGMSRRHTHIEPIKDQWVIRDLGSTNGTLVNGKKISSQVLHENDNIQFGDVTLKFIIKDQKKAPALDSAHKAIAEKLGLSSEGHKKKKTGGESKLNKISKRLMQFALWLMLIYCAWGYYYYMTTMKEAIKCHNDGIDLHDEGRYGEAITTLETAIALEKKSRGNLFVKFAYPYLPQRELRAEENIAKCYYKRGNNLYNNQEENLGREALKDFEKAFRLKPDIHGLAETLCQLAFGQSNWQLTIDSAEEALRQDPNNTTVEKIRDMAKKELSD